MQWLMLQRKFIIYRCGFIPLLHSSSFPTAANAKNGLCVAIFVQVHTIESRENNRTVSFRLHDMTPFRAGFLSEYVSHKGKENDGGKKYNALFKTVLSCILSSFTTIPYFSFKGSTKTRILCCRLFLFLWTSYSQLFSKLWEAYHWLHAKHAGLWIHFEVKSVQELAFLSYSRLFCVAAVNSFSLLSKFHVSSLI